MDGHSFIHTLAWKTGRWVDKKSKCIHTHYIEVRDCTHTCIKLSEEGQVVRYDDDDDIGSMGGGAGKVDKTWFIFNWSPM